MRHKWDQSKRIKRQILEVAEGVRTPLLAIDGSSQEINKEIGAWGTLT